MSPEQWFWTKVLLCMALMNFLLNMRMILLSRWIHNHVRHIEFHVCPDHEEWEEVRDRLQGAIEAHLRECEPSHFEGQARTTKSKLGTMVIDMSTRLKIREALTRLTQAVIGLDGFLHIAEVVSAYREQAWVTFGLTSLHTVVFFLAVYLVGHDHTHHKHEHEHEHEESDNDGIGKKVIVIIALVILAIALTPVAGELMHLGHDH